MTSYRGHETVEPGIYLCRRRLAFKSISERGPLGGREEDRYVAVPTVILFLAGPIIGLAYVIFLPLVGFASLGVILLDAARGLLRRRPTAPTVTVSRGTVIHRPLDEVVAHAGDWSAWHSTEPQDEEPAVEVGASASTSVDWHHRLLADGLSSEVDEHWTWRATDEGTAVDVSAVLSAPPLLWRKRRVLATAEEHEIELALVRLQALCESDRPAA